MPEESQQKTEEPKVENAVKDEPKVYRCRECADKTFAGCRWDEAKHGPVQKDKCNINPPVMAGKIPVWVVEEKKEEGKAEEPKYYRCRECSDEASAGCAWDEAREGPLPKDKCLGNPPLIKGKTPNWKIEERNEEVERAVVEFEALEKHGVSITITEALKAKLPEDLRNAVEVGAPIVVILDRPQDHNTWAIGSTKDFRKAVSFATKGSKITPEQAEQLQTDLNELMEVQKHLHDRIKAVDAENQAGQRDVKKAQAVLKEMDDMRKAKAAAEEAAKKDHDDFMKMFRDHKNMKEKLTKTTTALWDLRDGIKELYNRFNH